MSKKSRKRNKRLLALAGLITAGTLAAKSKRDASNSVVEANDNAFDIPAVKPTPKKKLRTTTVNTPTTVMDSMPARSKLNQKSKRVTDKGEVYTIEGAKEGVPKKIGNKNSLFVGDKYIYQDGKPYTKGRFGTFAARNKKPAMLGDSGFSLKPSAQSMSGLADGDFAAKNGGRAKLRSGGKVKGCGKALRGFGNAMKKGKR